MPYSTEQIEQRLAQHPEGLTLTELFPDDKKIALASQLARKQRLVDMPMVLFLAITSPHIWTMIKMQFDFGSIAQIENDKRVMSGLRCKYVLLN